jgi:glyoxylase-like metal-dependent hydrolase (beta-lactamase superfamily II)
MKMVNRSSTSTVATALAVAFLGFGFHAGAQIAPPRVTEPPAPVSTYNSKTDNLNRTEAGPLTKPIVVEIAKSTYMLNEFGMDTQYLVVGTNRALLIDTGSGFYDLRGMVEKLTKGLPYDVVLTDSHPDHNGAIGQFDAIYVAPADIGSRESKMASQHASRVYGETMWGMPVGYQHIWGYTPADAKWGGWDKHPELKPLADGHVFDLGGRKVTTFYAPGHTMGACIYLDEQSRILFPGDIAKRSQGTGSGTASDSLRALLKIQSLRPRFDRLYSAHNQYPGVLDVMSQDPQVLDDLIEDYREILRGTATYKTLQNPIVPEMTETVAVYGWAVVAAHPDKLWVPGEPHIVP